MVLLVLYSENIFTISTLSYFFNSLLKTYVDMALPEVTTTTELFKNEVTSQTAENSVNKGQK